MGVSAGLLVGPPSFRESQLPPPRQGQVGEADGLRPPLTRWRKLRNNSRRAVRGPGSPGPGQWPGSRERVAGRWVGARFAAEAGGHVRSVRGARSLNGAAGLGSAASGRRPAGIQAPLATPGGGEAATSGPNFAPERPGWADGRSRGDARGERESFVQFDHQEGVKGLPFAAFSPLITWSNCTLSMSGTSPPTQSDQRGLNPGHTTAVRRQAQPGCPIQQPRTTRPRGFAHAPPPQTEPPPTRPTPAYGVVDCPGRPAWPRPRPPSECEKAASAAGSRVAVGHRLRRLALDAVVEGATLGKRAAAPEARRKRPPPEPPRLLPPPCCVRLATGRGARGRRRARPRPP